MGMFLAWRFSKQCSTILYHGSIPEYKLVFFLVETSFSIGIPHLDFSLHVFEAKIKPNQKVTPFFLHKLKIFFYCKISDILRQIVEQSLSYTTNKVTQKQQKMLQPMSLGQVNIYVYMYTLSVALSFIYSLSTYFFLHFCL